MSRSIFAENVRNVLQPYVDNMINESAKDIHLAYNHGVNGPSFYNVSLLFFTHCPHLFLSFQSVEGDFRFCIKSYKELIAEDIIKDVCKFAKTFEIEENFQLSYVKDECKTLYEIIDKEFVPTIKTERLIQVDGDLYPFTSLSSPFLILKSDQEIEEIFNSI